MLAW